MYCYLKNMSEKTVTSLALNNLRTAGIDIHELKAFLNLRGLTQVVIGCIDNEAFRLASVFALAFYNQEDIHQQSWGAEIVNMENKVKKKDDEVFLMPEEESQVFSSDDDYEDESESGLEEYEVVETVQKVRITHGRSFGTLTWKGRPFAIAKHAHGEVFGGGMGGGTNRRETVYIWGKSVVDIRDFMQAAVDASQPKQDRTIPTLFVKEYQGGRWFSRSSKPMRTAESVVVPKDIRSKVKESAKDFKTSRKWHIEHGIPYRQSYLLYGPPGSGKTSFIHVLAQELNRNTVCQMQLIDKDMNDQTLITAIQRVPAYSIVMFEDIDAVFDENRKLRGEADKCMLTYSGLLQAIDGVSTPEGVVFVLVTNYPERLDSALIRPGRVDVPLEFGWATEETAGELFRQFYGNEEDEAHALAFGEMVSRVGRNVSMAELQNHFVQCRRKDACEAAASLVESDVLAEINANKKKRKRVESTLDKEEYDSEDEDDYLDDEKPTGFTFKNCRVNINHK